MKPLILVVEDEPPLQKLLAYNLEAAGFAVAQAFDGEEAQTLIDEQAPDLAAARLDAAAGLRARAVPPAAPPRRYRASADHHADRARRGAGPAARAGYRRRRLHRQAVLAGRADRPHPRRAAPGAPGLRRAAVELPRPAHGPGRAPDPPRRAGGPSQPDRVPAAAPLPGASRPRVQPRSVAGSGLGLGPGDRVAHRRCHHPAAAPGPERRRRGRSAAHRAGRGLFARSQVRRHAARAASAAFSTNRTIWRPAASGQSAADWRRCRNPAIRPRAARPGCRHVDRSRFSKRRAGSSASGRIWTSRGASGGSCRARRTAARATSRPPSSSTRPRSRAVAPAQTRPLAISWARSGVRPRPSATRLVNRL